MAAHVFVLPVVQCIVTDVGDGMVVFSQHQPKLQQKRPVPQPIRVPRPSHSQRLHDSGVFQLPQDIWGFEGERQFFGVGLDAADEARTGLLHRFDQGGQLVLEKQEGREKDNFRKNVVRKIVAKIAC